MKGLAAGIGVVFLSPLLLGGGAVMMATSSEAAQSTTSSLDCLSDVDTSKIADQVKHRRFEQIDDFVQSLADLRSVRGEIISLRELRYVDGELVDGLEAQVAQQLTALQQAATEQAETRRQAQESHRKAQELEQTLRRQAAEGVRVFLAAYGAKR